MSEPIKILVKEVKLSAEQKGMKLVTATVGTEPEKVYKFGELKQDGTPRKGYSEISAGEWSVYINGEYIASAMSTKPSFSKSGGGGGYKQNPQTQTEICKMNAIGNAVSIVNAWVGNKDLAIIDRVEAVKQAAEIIYRWVTEVKK